MGGASDSGRGLPSLLTPDAAAVVDGLRGVTVAVAAGADDWFGTDFADFDMMPRLFFSFSLSLLSLLWSFSLFSLLLLIQSDDDLTL